MYEKKKKKKSFFALPLMTLVMLNTRLKNLIYN